MIVLATYLDNPERGIPVIMVSHGIDFDTLQSIPLPSIPLNELSEKVWNEDINEWVLY